MCYWDTEYIEVTTIIQLYDVFVVDDNDDKDKAHNNLSEWKFMTLMTAKDFFFLFWQVNLQSEHHEKTVFVFITNFLWDKSMNIWT